MRDVTIIVDVSKLLYLFSASEVAPEVTFSSLQNTAGHFLGGNISWEALPQIMWVPFCDLIELRVNRLGRLGVVEC